MIVDFIDSISAYSNFMIDPKGVGEGALPCALNNNNNEHIRHTDDARHHDQFRSIFQRNVDYPSFSNAGIARILCIAQISFDEPFTLYNPGVALIVSFSCITLYKPPYSVLVSFSPT